MDFQIIVRTVVQIIKSDRFFVKKVRNIVLISKVLELTQYLLQVLFLFIKLFENIAKVVNSVRVQNDSHEHINYQNESFCIIDRTDISKPNSNHRLYS